MNAKRIVLTERDQEILYAVSKLGYARTRDITKVFFGSKYTCLHRLRKLFDADFLSVSFRSLNEENIYSLTKQGKEVIAEKIDKDDTSPVPPSLSLKDQTHFFAINDLRLNLALACRHHFDFHLEFFLSDFEIKKKFQYLPLIPDALCGIKDKKGNLHAFAFEIDLKTEKQEILQDKLKRYLLLLNSSNPLFGLDNLKVIFMFSSSKRLENFISKSKGFFLSSRFFFAIFKGIDETNILNNVYAFFEDLRQGNYSFSRSLFVEDLTTENTESLREH